MDNNNNNNNNNYIIMMIVIMITIIIVQINKGKEGIQISKHFHPFCLSARNALQNVHV